MTEYETETTNATNTLTATPKTEGATVAVELDGEAVTGSTITWGEAGEHELTITVTAGALTKVYTVTVTNS